MDVKTTMNGYPVYSGIIEKFSYGVVYYLDEPYICDKNNLHKVNTKYLAGRRKELIVSTETFNSNSQFRYVIPITSYHEDSMICSTKILFKGYNGKMYVLHLDEMRSRHVADFSKEGSGYCYTMSSEFMKVVSEKLVDYTQNSEATKINKNSLEERISLLEEKLLSNSTQTNTETFNNVNTKKTKKSTTKKKTRKSDFSKWSKKKKEEFKNDSLTMTRKELSKKYKIGISTVYRYLENFPDIHKMESKKKDNFIISTPEYESQIDKFNRRWNKSANTTKGSSTKHVFKSWPEKKQTQFIIDIKTNKTTKQIASEYGISQPTVSYYRNKLKKVQA